MDLPAALAEMTALILKISPDAVIRTQKRNAEEMTIRAYVPAEHEEAIQEAARDRSIELLTKEGLDIQVLTYDIANNLPPEA